MINIIDNHCITYNCYTIITKKYKGYCFYCFVHIFPDEKISKNYKSKENTVIDYIK
jgi:hypothetical protein